MGGTPDPGPAEDTSMVGRQAETTAGAQAEGPVEAVEMPSEALVEETSRPGPSRGRKRRKV
jgi:hypothetical protein